MEVNKLLFPGRWPLRWGLVQAFEALRHVELYGMSNDLFHDSFYLATHIVYALSAYSSIKTEESAVPWLYKYCRKVRGWVVSAKGSVVCWCRGCGTGCTGMGRTRRNGNRKTRCLLRLMLTG